MVWNMFKLTIKTPERRLCGASKSFIKPLSAFIKPSEASQWRRSGAFIVNLLLAYFAICSSVSIENFEHVVAGYE